MPLLSKTWLSADEFTKQFNNLDYRNETYALYRFEKNSQLLTWGYAHNEGCGNAHAEELVLQEIEKYENEMEGCNKYKLKLFISYTPCPECCDKIQDFLAQKSQIAIEINASRIYYSRLLRHQAGLRSLMNKGVFIKMMERPDYEETFHLFVQQPATFIPWHDLDQTSSGNVNRLNEILEEEQPQGDGKEDQEKN